MSIVITEDQIREKLKEVQDPELFINIVDLGLIYEIRIDELEGKTVEDQNGISVFVLMTLTSPGCPLAGTFEKMVTEAVKQLEGVEEVNIELTWDPPWNQEMMSEEAKAELGFF